MDIVPEWMRNLEEEDVAFIKKLVLASGSLKEVVGQYGVTYPTVRLRLDKLIQRIQINDQAVNEKLDFDTFLCRRQNKWLGLILPAMSFLGSILAIVWMVEYAGEGSASVLVSSIILFFISNFPTLVMFGIYFACRERFSQNHQLNHMNIQDLT